MEGTMMPLEWCEKVPVCVSSESTIGLGKKVGCDSTSTDNSPLKGAPQIWLILKFWSISELI